ncbi:hypothetical protein GGR57DRAFT_498130 [Xylariaceae sp. FL1272]|nr:hypothetical protein GGR57DRAFT_498130 [Xylariaceae sp. FL1272]
MPGLAGIAASTAFYQHLAEGSDAAGETHQVAVIISPTPGDHFMPCQGYQAPALPHVQTGSVETPAPRKPPNAFICFRMVENPRLWRKMTRGEMDLWFFLFQAATQAAKNVVARHLTILGQAY